MDGAVSVLQMNAHVGQYPGVHEKFNALVKEIGVGAAEEIVGVRPDALSPRTHPSTKGQAMLDRLRRVLMIWKWDLIIIWRACQGRWYIFRDVPTIVVARFASANLEHFERRDLPEAVNAIHQARAELALREQVMRREIEQLTANLHAALEALKA